MAGKKKDGLSGFKTEVGRKKREDRNSVDPSFPLISIDAKEICTAVLLIQSPESNVKLTALGSLDNYIKRDSGNLKVLSTFDVLGHLMNIARHDNNLFKRFSCKLIAMLSSLENFRQQMMKEEGIVKEFLDWLNEEEDIVLQEYTSLVLANFTSDYSGASDLLSLENSVDIVLQRIDSKDPDVLKNCLTVLSQLLNDPNAIDNFVVSPNMNMNLLINTIFSSYEVIQRLGLQVLTKLTSACKDPRILFMFRDAKGLEAVLTLLENNDWADLYSAALDLIIHVVDNPEMSEYFYRCGGLSKFVSYLDDPITNQNGKVQILEVLARLSQSKKGQEVLHLVEMEPIFIENLEAHEIFQEPACLGITNLSQYHLSLARIVDGKAVQHLLAIILDKNKGARVRNIAAHGLNIICNSSNKAVEDLLKDEESYQGLFAILTESPNLSTELCQSVIQTFIEISPYEVVRKKLTNEKFLSALMSNLPSDPSSTKDPCIQVDVLECLSEYMVESNFRSLFVQSEGVKTLLKCLQSKFASVREWAGHLVMIMAQSETFIEEFIDQDGLDWMLKEKNTMYSMPSWQSAIETIFTNFLPAKFAYTGRLDFQDITKDGFYVLTNPTMKFMALGLLEKRMLCPVSSIYLVDFSITRDEVTETSSLTSPVTDSDLEIVDSFGRLTNSPPESIIINFKRKIIKDQLPREVLKDPNLNEHLENLKKKIAKEELPLGDTNWSSLHPTLICSRARIIAEFVAEEMSSPDSNYTCNSHYKMMHIKELKFYMGTNIFPLGVIRIGDYLERALLFKVLADRIGFPCALVRGSYGRVWIEIAIPVINIEDISSNDHVTAYTPTDSQCSSEVTLSYKERSRSETSVPSLRTVKSNAPEDEFWFPKIHLQSFKGLPSDYLKPNVIVDLVCEPGRLLNINSVEAEEYCGTFLFQSS